MTARGKRGTVHLSSGTLTIQHTGSVGWRATVGATETRIPIDSVIAIQLKAATPFSNGSLRFIVAGEHAPGHSSDESAVAFTYWQHAAFEDLAKEVARAIAVRSSLAVVA